MDKAVSYQKSIGASTENLSEVRKFVTNYAQKHGFSKDQIADIRLAVDEAATNIIKHAYKSDDSQTLTIKLEFDDEKLCVTLTDQGISFDVKKYKSPDIKQQIAKKKRGGMGIHLMKNLMDEVSYKVKNQENVLRMSKNRN